MAHWLIILKLERLHLALNIFGEAPASVKIHSRHVALVVDINCITKSRLRVLCDGDIIDSFAELHPPLHK